MSDLEELDQIISQWPQNAQDFTTKRLKQITKSLQEFIPDPRFLVEDQFTQTIKQKQKANDGLATANNLSMVTSYAQTLVNDELIDSQTKLISQQLQPMQQLCDQILASGLPHQLERLIITLNGISKECQPSKIVKQHQDYTTKLNTLQFELEVVQNLERDLTTGDLLSQINNTQQASIRFGGVMGQSLKDLYKQLEQQHQSQLTLLLRQSISIFEQDLWQLDEKLKLLDVVMHILRHNNQTEYTFMINELADARVKYIKLNFKQTCKLLDQQQVAQSKKVAVLLAWLSQSYQQETKILKHTSLENFKIEEILELIFQPTMIKIIRSKIEQEIKQQQNDFVHTFEMVQVLSVPQKLLEPVDDLTMMALEKFAQSSDGYLQKLKQKLNSPQSFESQLQQYTQVLKKTLQSLLQDNQKKFFHKRILLYGITRVVGNVYDSLNDVTRINLQALVNYYDDLLELTIDQDQRDLILERIKFIESYF